MHDFTDLREYVVSASEGLVYKAQWWHPCCHLGCITCVHWVHDIAAAYEHASAHAGRSSGAFIITERDARP